MASIGCQADGSVCRRGFTDADAAGRDGYMIRDLEQFYASEIREMPADVLDYL